MERLSVGIVPDGRELLLFRLKKGEIEADIINYGAALSALRVPDSSGGKGDIVLGFDKPMDYLGAHPCFGTINGRFANRIAKGKFSLNGKSYELAVNNGPNHLHGGPKGFDKVIWEAEEIPGKEGVCLKYLSRDGEEGYPGNLSVEVSYMLNDKGGLDIIYKAETDQDTILNLTNHTYFNLALQGSVEDHLLKIYAERYTPIDQYGIPKGELALVAGTPFDFRTSKRIGENWQDSHEQLGFGSGYDHNFVLDNFQVGFRKVAEVKEPSSGRQMEVYSTEPGLQLYTANHLGGLKGKGGKEYRGREAFCLELQHFPDSPNQENFPSTILKVGDVYTQHTEYRFIF
ncbi:MAG: aldose epimerase family protein [Bacteroidota bacterium]